MKKELSIKENFISEIKLSGLYIGTFLKWLAVASLIGCAGGIIGAIFDQSIEIAEEYRNENPWMLWLLPIAGLIIVGFYRACKTDGLNTNHVIRAVHKGRRLSPLLVPSIFIGTVLTHLCGGSAGREGAALQMGGTLGQWIGRQLHLDDSDLRIATLAGMSAFFSAIFGTPLAAAVFAVMVISIGILYHVALVPCLISSLVAYFVAHAFGVKPVRFSVDVPTVEPEMFLRVMGLAILCAVVSILFCDMMQFTEKIFRKRVKNPYLRAICGGAIIIVLTFICGTNDFNGVGMDVISAAVEQGEAEPIAFLLKLLFTAITLGAGFKGGEIVPSFFVGATFGCVIGPLLGIPAGFAAAIGLTCVFCGVTNCPISSIFLSIELFGAKGMLYFAVACCLCYMMSGYKGIYSSQQIMYSKRKAKFINAYTNGKKGSDA